MVTVASPVRPSDPAPTEFAASRWRARGASRLALGPAQGAALRGALRTLLDLIGLVALTLALGARVHAFTGFPEGNDAWGHLSKTQFVLDSWPHVAWNYQWYSGMPTFLGSYPPGYHLFVAGIAALFRIPAPAAMNIVACVGVIGVVVGVYGTVRAASGSRWAAVIAAAALLGTPTMWAQVVTYGLYPRLLGLSAVALAVACATRVAVRGGRLTMLGTALTLAVGLSMHPVVGIAGMVLVAAMILLGTNGDGYHRVIAVAGVLTLTGGLAAYFYVPLVLLPRAQSPWTDQEVPLTPAMLVWSPEGALVGLSPVLLPLALVVVALVVAALVRPRLTLADKVALGIDVSWLATGPDEAPPRGASRQVRALAAWRTSHADNGFARRAILVLVVGVPGVFAYGFIGYVVPHFPYYVNGLQPIDLLVYPAWLLACVVGVGLGLVLRRRPGWTGRGLRLPLLSVVAALVVAGLLGTSEALPAGSRTNSSAYDRTRPQGLPEATDDHEKRLAVATDSTSSFVNAVSSLPQTRGYQDHGNLQQDYQIWFESALLGSPDESYLVRHFLLDWNATGWVMADPIAASLTWERADPMLRELPVTESPFSTFAVASTGPVLSASAAPTVLVVGDRQHYDLVLHALAQADVGSDDLIPVQGPATFEGLSAPAMSAYDTVLLYGGAVGDATSTAKALHAYARGGGHVVIADSDTHGPAEALINADRRLLPVTALVRRTVRGDWNWEPGSDPALSGVDFDAFGDPSYAGTGTWEVEAGTLARDGNDLLTTGRSLVAATHPLGRGSVSWEGFALPYHAADARSADEGRLLGNLLGASSTAALAAATSFDTSERRTVIAPRGVHGVLVKEHAAPDWHATVDGREVAVMPAGPGMMWVPLPAGHGRVTVVLDYRLGVIERAGYAISAAALLVLLLLTAVALVHRRRRFVTPTRWSRAAST